VADLVDYRKKVIPTLKPGSPFPDTFPHLFMIVDEFAEMVTQNPDYKAKFESITRLGRSFGVTLILATQRPSGAVTDQMRSNMKFRICLRVETTDDSKEMLGRPDGATLPALGGRGYVQVGGGPLAEVQAAWAGAPYDENKPDPVYPTEEILQAIGNPLDAPRSTLGWLVGALALEAQRQKIPRQFKPWPYPLPERLPLNSPVNAEYIQNGQLGKDIVINPHVAGWLDNTEARPLWKEADWSKPVSLKAAMGIIDNPYLAEQRVLTLNASGDPIIAFGGSGRGKTTFLKSLVVALAAEYSPEQLHIFALDFGRGGLKAFRKLPHMAGIVDANEDERVERLLRMVRAILEDRQAKLQAYDSLDEYNTKNPGAPMPAVLVLIDNISEFKETYEKYLMELVAQVRDGRSFGVYFAVTAALPTDCPSKLFNILTQRVTFTQPDASEYTTIVGRGWTTFNDKPGRGLTVEIIDEKPYPLEFHTGTPVMEGDVDPYRILAERMAQAWETLEAETPARKARKPKSVETLAKFVDLQNILGEIGSGTPAKAVPVGINDVDREPTMIEFADKGPHILIVGPPVTGKTTLIRSLVLSLAYLYPPEKVAMVLIDPSDMSRRFYNYGTSEENRLDRLPHVLATVSNAKEMDRVVKLLMAEYDEDLIAKIAGKPTVFQAQDNQSRAIFLIIDHFDEAESVFNKSGLGLAGLTEVGKGKNMHIVMGGSMGILRGSDDLRKRAEAARYSLILNDFEAVRFMGVRTNISVTKELPPGRGFLVKAVSVGMMHAAMPYVDGKNGQTGEEQLDSLITAIRTQYTQPARWSYHGTDLEILEIALRGDEVEPAGPGEIQTPLPPTADGMAAMADLEKMMKEQGDLEALMASMTVSDADPSQMVALEIPDEPAAAGNGSGNGSGGTPEPEAEAASEATSSGKKSKKK
jgi:DNA segregation ATPase FtsK/SpoIIIE-like protein